MYGENVKALRFNSAREKCYIHMELVLRNGVNFRISNIEANRP